MQCCCEGKSSPLGLSPTAVDLTLIEGLLNQYRQQEGSLVTVLQKAQDIYGFLPMAVMRHIADQMGVKPARVFGVATFYTQFRFQPVGKYLILLCQGTACHVNGSERIETALCQELKIKAEETTSDGLFTISNVACLGCCSLAPVMMINGQAYGPLTPDKALSIVRDLGAREKTGLREGAKDEN